MTYLYAGTILTVNLSDGKISREPTSSYSGTFLGGRGINIKLLYDGVPPEVSPLDPASLLIFGAGPLCGTPVPASRVEVTAKSPETGYLGSSNFGGYFGPELKFAGYDHIVITGKADKPVYLWIYNGQVELRDASHLWGKDTFKTQEVIRSEVGPDARTVCIGQAGENLVHFATLEHELGHGAGRTGMGAVMGAKNLKAIVVRGTKGISLANSERYLSIVNELLEKLRNNPAVQETQKYGMSRHQDEFAPQTHYTPDWEPRIRQQDVFNKYQSKMQRTGCLGCPQQCKDLYPVEVKGGGAISCTFYCQPLYRVRNNDADLVIECGLLAHRYGVDIVSSMGIIRWLMELHENGVITAGDTDGIPMEWGSKEAILGMLKKMVFREGFGDVLADGILPAARKIGCSSEDYAEHIKGLPQYNPSTRYALIPLKGSALGLVMSSRGDSQRTISNREVFPEMAKLLAAQYGEKRAAEYREGVIRRGREITGSEKAALPEEYEGKPKLIVYAEDKHTIDGCLSSCTLMGGKADTCPFNERYRAELYSAGSGIETSVEALFAFAKRVRNAERAYCVREGMTRETDSLPKQYMDRPIERGKYKGSVLETSKFEAMKSEYYALRGWDLATGIPTRQTLEQTGVKDIAEDLERRGKLPRVSVKA